MWKDYYLEHHRRLNTVIAQRCGAPKTPGFVKKPNFGNREIKDDGSPPLARRSKPLSHRVEIEKIKHEKPRQASKRSPAPRSPSPTRSPSVEINKVPSRCPTPPTEAVFLDAAGRAARYTDDDRKFLVNYARWRLHQESSLSRDALARELNEKV